MAGTIASVLLRAALSALLSDSGASSTGCVSVKLGASGGGSGASCSCLVVGDARFSVLTPSVIRMEHHAGCTTGGSGCFDDEVCVCSPDRCWPALLLTPRAALS